MKLDSHYEGVEGVREPYIKLVRGGGKRGRRDKEVLGRALQAFPVGLVPQGSGGGAFVGRCGKVDKDGDVV